MDNHKQKRLKDLQRDQLFESELNEIMERMGITFSEEFNLILHNDNINDMLHVVLSLSDVCRISYENSMRIMMEAHTKGRAIVRNGNIDELHYMKLELNESRGLTYTLERAE